MTVEIVEQLKKPTSRQKLSLADQLLTVTGAHRKPAGIRSSDDPALEEELHRRLSDRDTGVWLSVAELKARTRH